MKLTQFAVDDGPHNSDGLLLHGWNGNQQVTGFVSRRVMDDWVDPRQPYRGRKSLYREQYNALGKRNLAAIERIVTSKYQRGPAFNRQYPFVDVLLSDITESGEVLDARELVRSPETDVASRAWPQGSLMLRNSRHPQKARTFESTSITQNSKRESKIALRHFEPAAKPRQLADFGPGRT